MVLDVAVDSPPNPPIKQTPPTGNTADIKAEAQSSASQLVVSLHLTNVAQSSSWTVAPTATGTSS